VIPQRLGDQIWRDHFYGELTSVIAEQFEPETVIFDQHHTILAIIWHQEPTINPFIGAVGSFNVLTEWSGKPDYLFASNHIIAKIVFNK
jgi:hypothetical protein